MLQLWSFHWLLFLFSQLNVEYAGATWPSSNFSSIQLLGLFQDAPNASESDATASSVHSRAMFKAAILLSQQYKIMIEEQFIGWEVANTGGNVICALSSTCRAMSTSNIIGIVGPAFSREAHIIAALAKTVGIPAISYAATDPKLSDRNAYPAFYRTVPSDNTAALSVVKLFIRFNWTSCVVIYQNDEFGSGGLEAMSRAFNKNGLLLSETLMFDIATLSIRGDLKNTLSSGSTRIVVLWAEPTHTSSVLQNALNNDVLGPQFLWILRSSVSLISFNQTSYQKLIGILTVEPVVGSAVDAPVNQTLLNAAYEIWQQYEPETFPGSTQVNDYALFAFDATWLFVQSLQQLCSTTSNISSSCLSVINSSFCFDRRFINANAFLDTISATEFLGVSGPIQFSVNLTDRISGNDYVVQNIQPSSNGMDYVPILEWSDSGDWKTSTRTNVILWPGNSLASPTGLAGLAGVHLRIGVIQASPFTMITDTFDQNSTKLIGYIPDLIDLLQNAMGFTADIVTAPSNQTYDGLIQAVAAGVYDMIVGDVTITAARREIADFSSSIFDNSLRIIVRQSTSVDVDLFAYLRPFSLSLWLTLLAACIYAAILICLLERQENEALKDKSILSSCSMSMWYSFGTLMGYGADFQAKTAAGRLLSVGLYILSLVLVATYTANLASDLTTAKSKDIISGIDDIKNGKIPFSRIGIIVGSSLENYYVREISDGSRNFYSLKSQSEIYTDLLNNVIDASIMDTGILEYVTSTLYCNLTLVGTDFSPSAFGIVIPKEWIYTQALDVNILSLRESGTLDDLKRKWFEGKTCADLSLSDTPTGVDIVEMSGLFLTFAVITILSLFLFAWKKRFIIKDYLCTPTRRKNSLVQQEDSLRTSSTKI